MSAAVFYPRLLVSLIPLTATQETIVSRPSDTVEIQSWTLQSSAKLLHPLLLFSQPGVNVSTW